MNENIQNTIKKLQHAIIIARLNYEIWWTYKEKESRKRYVNTLNTYPLFFQTSLHAHFVAMIASLYRLYEVRKDTINLPQLLKVLKNENQIKNSEIKTFELEIKTIKPLWVKVSVLRNKMFGHRSNALNDNAIWKEASVTPDQFKQLIEESERILNAMTSALNRSSHLFNLSSKKDVVHLLEDLKKIKK